MTPRVVIAFGSNLGDRAETIVAAAREIADLPGIELTALSSLHETPALKPHGVDFAAPAYLNAIAIVETDLDPHELLARLREIEQQHGRVREERWGDRTLDLDIIDADGMAVTTDDLTLPHPRAHERAFVLEPWLEVDPEAVLSGRRVSDLLAEAPR
ncbi:2-amino-4-hydroxy-6-hydroxymethyldihydropteridine diphosphokinase [Leifsonia sp. AK011]|uniref:2-amino-4-hydroxy-6- hydroxymethyldihydropteridine diphosphokinase n=1 Tax=Leifsonia sp. AK011 TaxID=2723075 RepID=UPI0015C6C1A4|nr:2-amino-4-hydroxy-6-hydroxymethyldihydropteridine diphosphokinase [Leifsonia sp. AK011]NYF09553.1 2-amino-4-hydroxy-6-hydroxymethyldihydropteridine diphosphokinase [Leifsonia sp. AK011]